MEITCNACRLPLDESLFHRHKQSLTGYRGTCKVCRDIRDNRPELLARRKALARANKNKECVICKDMLPLKKFYTQPANADGHSKRCRPCTQASRGVGSPEYKAKEKVRYRRNWAKSILYAAKLRSKLRDVPFALTPEDIFMPEVCPVLGIPLVIGGGMDSPNRPTLDRKVPALGYVKGNAIVISWRANKLKGDEPDPEVFERIAAYMRGA